MLLKSVFLGIIGLSFGLLAAAGVFTVLVSVGLVPRFAGKTHTSKKVFLYEEMVVAGTLTGCVISVFQPFIALGEGIVSNGILSQTEWNVIGNVVIGIYGVFAGMFVGCLALAIAEMLGSIPIFARRIGFRHGLGIAIFAMAMGKLCGSVIYFWLELYRTVG